MNRVIQVKDIAALNLGTFKKNEFPTKIKYLDTSNLTKNRIQDFYILDINSDLIPSRAQRKVKQNTILYSTVRPNQEHYGIIENVVDNIVVSTGFTTLDVIDEDINPKYLFYLLTQPHITDYLHTIATNSVSSYPSISPNDLGNLKFRVPTFSIQQKIASALSSLDSKIELNTRINAELEAMAKTLYEYWFVQFDFPASAAYAASAGKPELAGKPYKSSGGKMVWNEELKREIPEGWEVERLDKLIDTIIDNRGKTPLKLGGDWATDKDGIIALSAKHVKDGKLLKLEEANVVTYEMFQKWMPNKLQEGDILMTSEAPCGEFYLILNDTNYCLSQRLFGIRANKAKVLPTYLYFELSRGNGFSQIIGKQSGSTVFGIRQEELRSVNILRPFIDLQKNYNERVRPMLFQIRNNEAQNLKLAELRDWLLPMLMNGQVKVKDEMETGLSMAAEPKGKYKKG